MSRRLLRPGVLLALGAALSMTLLALPDDAHARKRANRKPRAPTPTKIAAGLHDGDLFTPRLRPDGEWVAYGILESEGNREKKRWFARSLVEDGKFRSIWPNQHPALRSGEGTASFTDLVDFLWHPDQKANAMVARHKNDGEEILLELTKVRGGGAGPQYQPDFDGGGARMVLVGKSERSGELYVLATTPDAQPERLTYTRDWEQHPDWQPGGDKILHEIRADKRSDLFVYDLSDHRHSAVLREPNTDEVWPLWSPDGTRYAYLSNRNHGGGRSYDLFVATWGSQDPPRVVIPSVRTSDQGPGYAWSPDGHALIAVQDVDGQPIVAAPADASRAPVDLGVSTRDNLDPSVVAVEGGWRLAWVGDDPRARRGRQFRVVYVADWEVATFYAIAEIEPPPAPAEPEKAAPDAEAAKKSAAEILAEGEARAKAEAEAKAAAEAKAKAEADAKAAAEAKAKAEADAAAAAEAKAQAGADAKAAAAEASEEAKEASEEAKEASEEAKEEVEEASPGEAEEAAPEEAKAESEAD